jgi:hypothetical protein
MLKNCEAVVFRYQNTQLVESNQLSDHVSWGEVSSPETHIETAIQYQLQLLRYPNLDLVDLQFRVALSNMVQNQGHRVVASIRNPHLDRRRRTGCPLGGRGSTIHLSEDLSRLNQEGGSRPG